MEYGNMIFYRDVISTAVDNEWGADIKPSRGRSYSNITYADTRTCLSLDKRLQHTYPD